MKVQNATDPRLIQLRIIGSRAEWQSLIDAVSDLEDDEMADYWAQALNEVIIQGLKSSVRNTAALQKSVTK